METITFNYPDEMEMADERFWNDVNEDPDAPNFTYHQWDTIFIHYITYKAAKAANFKI